MAHLQNSQVFIEMSGAVFFPRSTQKNVVLNMSKQDKVSTRSKFSDLHIRVYTFLLKDKSINIKMYKSLGQTYS